MPSGSHGGSFSGGGSSFSGGSSFGSGSSHNRFHSHRTIIVIGGRRYTVNSKVQSAVSSLLSIGFFLIFFVFTGILMFAFSKAEVNQITEYHNKYHTMVEIAENNPNLIRQGEILTYYYHEDCGKYYFTYRIEKDSYDINESKYLDGYSYDLYSLEEVQQIVAQETIDIAVDSNNVTAYSDTCPMNFKNKTLTDDGDYLQANKTARIGLIILISFGVISASMITVGLVLAFKNKEEIKKVNETDESKSTTQENTTDNSPKKVQRRYCSYCGELLGENETKCPNCKAKNKY